MNKEMFLGRCSSVDAWYDSQDAPFALDERDIPIACDRSHVIGSVYVPLKLTDERARSVQRTALLVVAEATRADWERALRAMGEEPGEPGHPGSPYTNFYFMRALD